MNLLGIARSSVVVSGNQWSCVLIILNYNIVLCNMSFDSRIGNGLLLICVEEKSDQ